MTRTKRHLSPARQQLLRLCQQLNFGVIRQLHVQRGEPVFQPTPIQVKDWKLDGELVPENASRPETDLADYHLKQQHHRLFEVLDTIHDGYLDEIHIRYGLPCRVMTSHSVC